MDPSASVEQYEARYGDADDQDLLEEVLADATREIAAALERAGIRYSSPDDAFADRLMQTCRSMAYRAMGQADSDVPAGITQYTQGTGDFSESFSFRNPYGEVYISKAEQRLLGLGAAKVGFAVPGATDAAR